MESRWYHRPILHSPAHGHERKVGWLELFYDLIYVATFIQLGNALSHDVSITGFLKFSALMIPIWGTWSSFTFYSNRYIVDDFLHRALVFGQMFAIGGVAAVVPGVFEGESAPFAFAFASARLFGVAMWARSWRQVDDAVELNRLYVLGWSAGLFLWALSIFLPEPWVYAVWAVAIAIDLGVPNSELGRRFTARYPPDALHMSERYGLLIIIVLGESFVKVLTEAAERGATPTMAFMCGGGLAITCSMWWIYFDDVAGSRIKRTTLATFGWVMCHLPLSIAVTGIGVAIKKVAFTAPFDPVYAKYRWLMVGTLSLALVCVGVIDSVTERPESLMNDKWRQRARFAAAGLILILAPISGVMDAWLFMGMIGVAMIGQVLFDLSMAPEKPRHHHEEEEREFYAHGFVDDKRYGNEAAREKKEEEPAKPRFGVEHAIRKGVPNELRRDVYVLLMEGSWKRLLGYLVSIFLFLNVVFGALYLLEPTGVANLDGTSFLESFAFSVQTMAAIGYGVMAPQSAYAHLLVVSEALIGLLFIALSTGLVFAKASRARSSVLFSERIVVTKKDGVPTLMLRVANARGNDLVEATMRISVLIEEQSPEGLTFRRLHDCRLLRSQTPLFSMSWTVFHPIEEDSPLYGMDEAEFHEDVLTMVATMTAHDSTFAQTTHARRQYFASDVDWDHRFEDVMSTSPEGRLILDFDKFHITNPEA